MFAQVPGLRGRLLPKCGASDSGAPSFGREGRREIGRGGAGDGRREDRRREIGDERGDGRWEVGDGRGKTMDQE